MKLKRHTNFLNESDKNNLKSWGSLDDIKYRITSKSIIIMFNDEFYNEDEIKLLSKGDNDPLLDDIIDEIESNVPFKFNFNKGKIWAHSCVEFNIDWPDGVESEEEKMNYINSKLGINKYKL